MRRRKEEQQEIAALLTPLEKDIVVTAMRQSVRGVD
jgi:hypothetical protein